MEVWKDIKGYEGLYQVSDIGRVKSCERSVSRGNYFLSVKEKIMSPVVSNNGYFTVCLSKDNKKIRFLIHRLVMIAFNDTKDNSLEVNHINGIKSDNSLINLEWCSRKQNINHAIDTGLIKNFGENHYSAKLTKEQAIDIKYNLSHLNLRQVSEIYGIRESLVSRIRNGKRWSRI